jgi:hypothetical protein
MFGGYNSTTTPSLERAREREYMAYYKLKNDSEVILLLLVSMVC